jgi:hypothetical protein
MQNVGIKLKKWAFFIKITAANNKNTVASSATDPKNLYYL